ncbi:MAG: class I SAM-dependent methyltransferase [Candidatus Anammoximicrobium sp.]|nr:class I SAM-dependent methyltransferase [Candidatus Anammoximicrobium sp.]
MTPIIPGKPSNARPPGDSSDWHTTGIEDYRWLVSPEAERWLEIAAGTNDKSLVQLTLALRKDLGPTRTHLVIAQTELRRRARVKFQRADRMFFTRQLLEQATDETIAAYKARRLAAGERRADLCCGIGGDLMAMAHHGPVVGIDRDPVAWVLAEANCQAVGLANAEVRLADACVSCVEAFAAWHIDPDRRPQGKRTTRVEVHEPDLAALERLLSRNPNAALKLAPAAELPEAWRQTAEFEWLGSRGECRQQMVWFRDLARYPGRRTATVFAAGSAEPRTISGNADLEVPPAASLGRYVYEPHAAVLAAGLTGILADAHSLHSVSPGIAYLTGDRLLSDPVLACFEVTEVLPLDPKHLRDAVRERGIGNLEVKKRGVKIDPEEVRKQLHLRGDQAAALLITPIKKKVAAILAKRVGAAAPEKHPAGEDHDAG